MDVDDSGGQAPVSPIDAVLVINLLNAGLGGPVPVDDPIVPPFLDVSIDGFVAPIDAVRARLGKGNLRRPQQANAAKAPAEAGGVAAEIVAALKALIAAEVRLQLHTLLHPENTEAAAPPEAASHS